MPARRSYSWGMISTTLPGFHSSSTSIVPARARNVPIIPLHDTGSRTGTAPIRSSNVPGAAIHATLSAATSTASSTSPQCRRTWCFRVASLYASTTARCEGTWGRLRSGGW